MVVHAGGHISELTLDSDAKLSEGHQPIGATKRGFHHRMHEDWNG